LTVQTMASKVLFVPREIEQEKLPKGLTV